MFNPFSAFHNHFGAAGAAYGLMWHKGAKASFFWGTLYVIINFTKAKTVTRIGLQYPSSWSDFASKEWFDAFGWDVKTTFWGRPNVQEQYCRHVRGWHGLGWSDQGGGYIASIVTGKVTDHFQLFQHSRPSACSPASSSFRLWWLVALFLWAGRIISLGWSHYFSGLVALFVLADFFSRLVALFL